MVSRQLLYEVIDSLRATAVQGLVFAENGYDRERYEHVLRAAARLAAAVEDQDEAEVAAQFIGNLNHISPAVGTEAAVIREGKILLIQRRDNQLWALPGGLSEVNETTTESVLRELREEARVDGQVKRLLGVFDSRLWNSRTRRHLFTLLFEVEIDQDPPKPAAPTDELSPMNETLDVGFFAENALPPLSPGHDLRVPAVFRMLRGEVAVPFFD
jgi:ADP-ribose pyrophosphatase YjhB (NUDIX family)